MIDAHWGFIFAAYCVTALVVGGMTLKIAFDYRALKKALGRMNGTNTAHDDVP
jgi:hypothetical protein